MKRRLPAPFGYRPAEVPVISRNRIQLSSQMYVESPTGHERCQGAKVASSVTYTTASSIGKQAGKKE
jgi:hypothetical protein